jgi:7-carboxy-7-deazaguanine synthase
MANPVLPVIPPPVPRTLAVNESFVSVQGEGINAGLPAYFLRLSGCDLSCSFCDSTQTWKKGVMETPTHLTAKSIIYDAMKNLPVRDNSQTLFVLTGGEPLLHQRRPAFKELMDGMKSAGYFVEVETAGHHIPDQMFLREKGINPVDQWNISPKLASSGNKFIDYRTTLGFYNDTVRKFQRVILKFVVGITNNLDAELEPIDSLVHDLKWPKQDVILMPEGIHPDVINEKSVAVIAAAISRGYRFGTRLHILAWGNKRGV